MGEKSVSEMGEKTYTAEAKRNHTNRELKYMYDRARLLEPLSDSDSADSDSSDSDISDEDEEPAEELPPPGELLTPQAEGNEDASDGESSSGGPRARTGRTPRTGNGPRRLEGESGTRLSAQAHAAHRPRRCHPEVVLARSLRDHRSDLGREDQIGQGRGTHEFGKGAPRREPVRVAFIGAATFQHIALRYFLR